MSTDDSTADEIQAALLWVRRQRGSFESRVAHAQPLIDLVGGGSLKVAAQELERVRRQYADDPEGDISAYFATAGHKTPGESLDQRLKAYAQRHHVVERTALRRSDRGAAALAVLLQDRLRYERPWAYVIAAQRGVQLHAFVRVAMVEGETLRPPAIYANGIAQRPKHEKVPNPVAGLVTHTFGVDPVPLNFDATPEAALGHLVVAWRSEVSPIWEHALHCEDSGLYSRVTLEPPSLLTLRVLRWSSE